MRNSALLRWNSGDSSPQPGSAGSNAPAGAKRPREPQEGDDARAVRAAGGDHRLSGGWQPHALMQVRAHSSQFIPSRIPTAFSRNKSGPQSTFKMCPWLSVVCGCVCQAEASSPPFPPPGPSPPMGAEAASQWQQGAEAVTSSESESCEEGGTPGSMGSRDSMGSHASFSS